MLDIVEDCYGAASRRLPARSRSTAGTTLIGDLPPADIILDRIVHNAYCPQLNGVSLRSQQTPKTAA
jgi:hypothetical protein